MQGAHGVLKDGTRRRSFLRACVGVSAGVIAAGLRCEVLATDLGGADNDGRFGKTDLSCLPPLFCTAYITPDAPGQGGQEAAVARYPLALVPQDARHPFLKWRNQVKELNPSILMLGYQMVIEETNVPGPGHDQLRRVRDAWCTYPGGFIPTVPGKPSGNRSRIYDPRKKEWQEGFLAACRATLASYPYHGLLLDQCTVFQRAHILESVRAEMRQALQETLLQLRHEFPDTLLVGNSSYNWSALNGEMNEGRFRDLESQFTPYERHASPRLLLYQSMIHSTAEFMTVQREMDAAHAVGALYGVSIDYQHVLWFDFFDALAKRCGK